MKQLPQWVEPRKLAQIGGEFHGVLGQEQLPRLADACESVGKVEANLRFTMNDQGKRMLLGSVKADLALQCQRCMESMSSYIEATVSLTMVWDEQEASALARELDAWIVGEGEHSLHEAVEDELLLSLPPAAYHDYDCIDPELLSTGNVQEEVTEEKDNPFSVLEKLKKN